VSVGAFLIALGLLAIVIAAMVRPFWVARVDPDAAIERWVRQERKRLEAAAEADAEAGDEA
jgi:hypothetical protein